MDLILWRHAEAEDGIPDEGRRLTSRGHKQAEKMAAWLGPRLPAGWRGLVSPAVRTRETALALTEDFELEPAVSTSATPQGLLRAAGWPDGRGTVVVVGHQPTLGAAAALALTGKVQAWNVKKGALWWIRRDDEGGILVRAVLTPGVL
jgi:phosphohistidine phosphatase